MTRRDARALRAVQLEKTIDAGRRLARALSAAGNEILFVSCCCLLGRTDCHANRQLYSRRAELTRAYSIVCITVL